MQAFPNAIVFCSIQPCARIAEGDLTVERDGVPEPVPVCARHAEYIMRIFAGDEIGNPDLLSQEIVFVDDVGKDAMLDMIIQAGTAYDIIGG